MSTDSLDSILALALERPSEERALIAQRLLSSLDERPEAGVASMPDDGNFPLVQDDQIGH